MKIAMACDHGGLRLKNVLKEDLEKNGYEVVDLVHTQKKAVITQIMLLKQQKLLLMERATRGLSYVELELVSALLPIK